MNKIAENVARAYIRRMSELHYIALFGADSDALRARLGLPTEDTFDDDNLRDHMGIEALSALSEVERECTRWMERNPYASPARTLEMCEDIAKRLAVRWHKQCAESGVDFLTGKVAA